MSERDTRVVTTMCEDVNLAQSNFIPIPEGGTIRKISCAIEATIAGGDLVITAEIGGVLVTGSTLTVTDGGSVAGQIDEVEPTALNIVPRDTALEILFDGGPTSTTNAIVSVEIECNVA